MLLIENLQLAGLKGARIIGTGSHHCPAVGGLTRLGVSIEPPWAPRAEVCQVKRAMEAQIAEEEAMLAG